ncbi:NYN domain-containing protein [Vibrio parahaemolyticus]|uniref:NYN domain-containing protein n=1 Tax=Vibrio TaxID=662 RepID=UPI0029659FC7|nr:NYN domain-containing protein [Vibrio sp. Y176]EIU6819353.1 NYN domain-containing protein [Vibrio parahaemolyticus]MDW1631041.1 NYN domain-containing protein [Vibrio sp. Y176]
MRTIVFVDYWNLQLSVQQEDARSHGAASNTHRFNINWYTLGQWLTNKVEAHLKTSNPAISLTYEETRIYTSTDPNDNGKYKNWVQNNLAKQPSIRAYCLDRKPKRHQNCVHCHKPIDKCPHCQKGINATQEKGVDTLLVTDLLSLGLDKSYDLAIIVSQDSDMKPSVQHLSNKGIKVVHAGIKHFGADLAKSCWATYDIFPSRNEIKR